MSIYLCHCLFAQLDLSLDRVHLCLTAEKRFDFEVNLRPVRGAFTGNTHLQAQIIVKMTISRIQEKLNKIDGSQFFVTA